MATSVEHHGKREWLVHGPDLDTGYGSFQGLGGLEALVDEATGETTPIVDTVHGHVVATINLGDIANAADDTVTFKEQQFGGYGPLPGSYQKPIEITQILAESLGWQTRCIDPTSFFAMGARHYDPLSGRFLSADPLGHGATPDLYSYAGGDPVNFVDPTGRAHLKWGNSMKIDYETEGGAEGSVKIENSRDFYDFFDDHSQSGDPIVDAVIWGHGSEDGAIVLGSDPDDPYGSKTTIQPNSSTSMYPDISVGLKSEEMQSKMDSAFSDDANIECDVCWGANGSGIADAIKESKEGATVKGYPDKAGIPFNSFAFRARAWWWQDKDMNRPTS